MTSGDDQQRIESDQFRQDEELGWGLDVIMDEEHGSKQEDSLKPSRHKSQLHVETIYRDNVT